MPSRLHFEPPGVSEIVFPQHRFLIHFQQPQRLGEGQVPRGNEMQYENAEVMEFESGVPMEFE